MFNLTPEQLAILISAMESAVTHWKGFEQYADESQADFERYQQGLQARNTLLNNLRQYQTNNQD